MQFFLLHASSGTTLVLVCFILLFLLPCCSLLFSVSAILFVALLPQCYFDFGFGLFHSAVPLPCCSLLFSAHLQFFLLHCFLSAHFDFGLFHSAVPADPAAHYYSLLAAILFVGLIPQRYFDFGLFHSAVPADLHFHYCHQHIFP